MAENTQSNVFPTDPSGGSRRSSAETKRARIVVPQPRVTTGLVPGGSAGFGGKEARPRWGLQVSLCEPGPSAHLHGGSSPAVPAGLNWTPCAAAQSRPRDPVPPDQRGHGSAFLAGPLAQVTQAGVSVPIRTACSSQEGLCRLHPSSPAGCPRGLGQSRHPGTPCCPISYETVDLRCHSSPSPPVLPPTGRTREAPGKKLQSSWN